MELCCKKSLGIIFSLVLGATPLFADNEDSSSDAPLGFGEALAVSQGVILKVPINASGEENTDGAELRFVKHGNDVLDDSNLALLWETTSTVATSTELNGTAGPAIDPRSDSSTWGWYYWYYRGWTQPYFYYSYYPTFYYNYRWHYYRFSNYWNWWGYRYYYYHYWYWY